MTGAADRIYENFIMRDLTYVFSGSLLLISILYVCEGNLINCIEYISQNLIMFIIFVGISYLTGYIVFTGAMFLKIFKKVQDVYAPRNELKILWEINNKYGPDTVKRIERESYLDRFARNIGSASLISALILLIPLFKYHTIGDIIIFSVAVLVSIICVMEDRRWFKKLRGNIVDLGFLNETNNQS